MTVITDNKECGAASSYPILKNSPLEKTTTNLRMVSILDEVRRGYFKNRNGRRSWVERHVDK
jgi:hypothetical protein